MERLLYSSRGQNRPRMAYSMKMTMMMMIIKIKNRKLEENFESNLEFCTGIFSPYLMVIMS
jgi:hypothetical protein